MKHQLFRLSLVAMAFAIIAQVVSAASISVDTADGRTVIVEEITTTIVKITNLGANERAHVSRASVLDGQPTNMGRKSFDDGAEVLDLVGNMKVYLNNDGTLSIRNGKGRVLLTDNSIRSVDGKNAVVLDLEGNGSFYGAGERGHKLNLRGDTLTMYNRQNYGYTGGDPRISQMNITMPLFLSTAGYAVVFDDYAAAELILSDPVQYITEGTEPVSYYFVVSSDGSLASLTTSLTELTGRQELPPFWALGYITSKYGYRTQQETENTIDSLKQLGYPVDGIVLDLYWYGKEQDMGRLAWESEQWPDPQGMLASLKDKGVNLVAISQPYVLRNGKAIDNYNELASKGMFVKDASGTAPQEVVIWVGEGGMFDVSNPDTRRWLANRYDSLTAMGVTGWWGDLGEPEVHPETGLHANGLTARQYHNQYGNDWSEIVYDVFKEKYPTNRLMTMMRGGTTGLQRYNVFPWSTDVSRSWGGLEPQITIMTQSGLSGLGYMGHDVGGFAVDPDNAYLPELYQRWLQLGLFSPVLRTHAQEYAEPFHYPQMQDDLLAVVKERYRWLPYNYTLAYENATLGYPLVRPLEFHSTNPTGKYDAIRDQYMWGRDVMIAPVLNHGATSRSVVFPDTEAFWYDLNEEGKTYAGGSVTSVAAPLNVIPMFARPGAFITLADYDFPDNTGDYRTDRYTVNYYVAPDSEVSESYIYEDDRQTPSSKLREEDTALINMSGETQGKRTTLTFYGEGKFDNPSGIKDITLKVHGLKTAPVSVRVNNKAAKFSYDGKTGVLSTDFRLKPNVSTNIVIE